MKARIEADREKIAAQAEELNRAVEGNAVLEAVVMALRGAPVSDFMQSFSGVREAMDERQKAEAKLTAQAEEIERLKQTVAALPVTLDSIAALVSNLEARLARAKTFGKINHLTVDGDGWYSCPLSHDGCSDESAEGCTCGADEHNARIEAI